MGSYPPKDRAPNGFVRARLTKELRFQGKRYFKQRTLLTGQGQSQGSRLRVNFTAALEPNGRSQSISAIAMDPKDKLTGIKRKRIGHEALKFVGMTGLNFLGTLSQTLAKKNSHGSFNPEITIEPILEDSALHAGGKAAISLSQEMMQNLKKGRPVVVINEGKEIDVLFTGNDSQK